MAINVSDNNPRINYTATSGQTVFTVPFEFFASTDLTVYVGGSVLATSAYTVTGGSGSTGSITTSSGQTAGAEIAIVRDVPLERTTDLTSSYSASSLNDQLDRIVTQVADLDDRVSRSISLNDYEVGVSLDLPAKASRLGKTVQFNSTTGALEIGPSGNELTSIASIASEITALDGIKANITTVAGAISNVNSVGSNISSVTSVASSISNVNTVNTNIANVNSVATSITDVNDVADSIDQVELVAGSISNVDIVGPAIANVNTVAGNISNINTVAAISANVTTVAGITAAISTVNSNATNINLAATNIDDVNDVANVITKVTTVADNIANVNTVAPSVSYLSTVANNISNINTLAPISADITTVAGVASSVSGAAANAAAAEAAKVAAQAAQAAAELAADNFDDTYLGAKASDPTLDNDGDSLGNGDLYFNTTDGTLKVYNNSAWQAAALDASGFVDVTGDSMTGNLLFGDGDKARFGIHGDLTIEHDLNNSNIIASNNKPLNITANGGFNINSDNIYFREHAASNTYMEMRDGGGYDHAVRIFHSGTDVRLETTSTGIDVTGTVTADGLTVNDTIRLDNEDTTVSAGDVFGDIEFYDNDGGSSGAGVTAKIEGKASSTYGASDINFYTSLSSGGARLAQSLAMTIGSGNDISFYEGTGTTAKFFWDASDQDLTITPNLGFLSIKKGVHDATNSVRLEAGGTTSTYLEYRGYLGHIWDVNTTEAMRIDSSGNVGIDFTPKTMTANVTSSLNVGSGTVFQRTKDTYLGSNMYYNASDVGKSISTGYGLAYYQDVTNGAHKWFTSAVSAGSADATHSFSTPMIIDSSGNVGIGTTSPNDKVDISGSTGDGYRLTDGTHTGVFRSISGGTILKTTTNHALMFGTNDAERMRINSAGNVGLFGDGGVQTIDHYSNYTTLALSNSTGGIIQFEDDGALIGEIFNGTNHLTIGSTVSGGSLRFRSDASSEAMRIDNSGNLLVGKPSSSFSTAGIELQSDAELVVTRNGSTASFNRLSTGNIVDFYASGSPVGSIGAATSTTMYVSSSSGGGLRFTYTGSDPVIAPCNTTGVDVDGSADLGHSAGRFKDLYLSGVSYVGATSNPSNGKVVIDYARGTSAGMRIKDTVGSGGTGVIADFYNSSNVSVGAITHNSSATAYNTSSDYRLKTDAQPMTGATDRLKQLNPVNFEWIADGTRVDGFLAHEAQAVVPEAVTGAKDAMRDEEYEVTPAVLDDDGNVVTEAVMGTRSVPDYQGIDQSKLVPLLVATIKELEARITALEAN